MGYVKVGILPLAGIFDIKYIGENIIKVKGGLEAEFLNLLSRGLGVKFKYSVPKLLNNSHQEMDTWTALIDMVKYFETDIAISKISLTEKRSLQINYSYPYTVDEMTFAIPIPSPITNPVAFLNPFSKILWIGVLFLWIIFPLIYRSFQPKNSKIKHLYLHFLGSFLNQNLPLTATNRKQALLITLWSFGAMFLSHSYKYSISLLSFMNVPLRERGIRTIAELARAVDSDYYSCAHLTGSGSYELFDRNKEPRLKAIGQNLKRNYIEFSPDKSYILTQMYTKKLIMIATRRDLHNLLYPHVYIASETFVILPLCVAFNNNFKQVNKLNEIIHRITASGIYEKSVRDFMFLKRLHSNANVIEQQQQPKPLAMVDLISVFSLFTIGIILSILTFILELIFWIYISQK